MHEAVYSSLPVVELLVRNGARTSLRNNDGKTPYHVAAYFHKTNILHVLQSHHKTAELLDISSLDESRHSELHRLVAADIGLNCMFRMSKSVEEAVDTLQEITDINKQNHCGHTPLHVARGPRAIEALLKCGNADSLTTKDTTGRNYFHLICTSKNLRSDLELNAIMNSAEEMRVNVNIGLDETDNFGRTPLHYAAMTHASVPYLDYILSVAPDSIRRQDVFGRTPLHYELSTGASEILSRSSGDDRPIVDEFNMSDRDYGSCRHLYRIWEIFDEIYPGKDFTLISPEFVEEIYGILIPRTAVVYETLYEASGDRKTRQRILTVYLVSASLSMSIIATAKRQRFQTSLPLSTEQCIIWRMRYRRLTTD